MAFAGIPRRDAVKKAIFETLEANGMRDGVHIRLTLSRGKKVTSSMDARVNQYGTTLIVIAEWKPPIYASSGVRLITSAIRRNPPQCVDSKIHHNNLINNILAKLEANVAGVDDAIMLDIHGYVSETNATNIFLIKRGHVLTPHADSCLPGNYTGDSHPNRSQRWDPVDGAKRLIDRNLHSRRSFHDWHCRGIESGLRG